MRVPGKDLNQKLKSLEVLKDSGGYGYLCHSKDGASFLRLAQARETLTSGWMALFCLSQFFKMGFTWPIHLACFTEADVDKSSDMPTKEKTFLCVIISYTRGSH